MHAIPWELGGEGRGGELERGDLRVAAPGDRVPAWQESERKRREATLENSRSRS
jgi:hypothetical protein